MRAAHGTACLVLVVLVALGACVEEQRYDVPLATVEMTADTPATFVDDEDNELFRVDSPLTLHISPPSADDLAKLATAAQGRMLPYPRMPWVALDDLDIQIDYALQNKSDRAIVAVVTLNGINEFQYYAPGPEDLHQWERRIALEPGARVAGTVTELDVEEIAIDLATVVNGAPNSNLVVSPESQARRDPRIAQFVPKVVPGLVGVRAGIETNRAAPLTLELSIRVQDHGDRAAKRGQRSWMLPEPAAFTPIAPEEE